MYVYAIVSPLAGFAIEFNLSFTQSSNAELSALSERHCFGSGGYRSAQMRRITSIGGSVGVSLLPRSVLPLRDGSSARTGYLMSPISHIWTSCRPEMKSISRKSDLRSRSSISFSGGNSTSLDAGRSWLGGGGDSVDCSDAGFSPVADGAAVAPAPGEAGSGKGVGSAGGACSRSRVRELMAFTFGTV